MTTRKRSRVGVVPAPQPEQLREPAKATAYLDPKHICAYDGPVKGCVCEATK